MIAAEDSTMRRERERLSMPFSAIGSVPEWIDEDIDVGTIETVCAEGPGIERDAALETMEQHGAAVLQYIEDRLGELPYPPEGKRWGAALKESYLSTAVQLWCEEAKSDLPGPDPD